MVREYQRLRLTTFKVEVGRRRDIFLGIVAVRITFGEPAAEVVALLQSTKS